MTRAQAPKDPRQQFFTEWQIPGAPETFVDLSADGLEGEVRLSEPETVRTTSGR